MTRDTTYMVFKRTELEDFVKDLGFRSEGGEVVRGIALFESLAVDAYPVAYDPEGNPRAFVVAQSHKGGNNDHVPSGG